MKIKLIAPARKSDWDEDFWSLKAFANLSGRKAGGVLLALPTLAALIPGDVDITITDENIEPIDFDESVDLVGISFLTALAPRAYEIAENFHARKIPVVLGGIHASMLPKEAIQHADSVVIGEAENIWPQLIEDFKRGELKKFYRVSCAPQLENTSIPRWDLVKTDNYSYFTVQIGRGCPNDCNFCSVTAFNGKRYRHKPIPHILREITALQEIDLKRVIFFADDNLLAVPSYGKRFLQAIEPLRIKAWWCQCSINRLGDHELLEQMYQAGCRVIFIGFESVSQKTIDSLSKGKVNQIEEYKRIVDMIHSHGIAIFGSFIAGNDTDPETVFDDIVRFVDETNIVFVTINILTPLPGTRLAQMLESQGRVLHKNWENYDTAHVCYKPTHFSIEDLQKNHALALQSLYSYSSLYKRFSQLWKNGVFVRDREGKAKLFTRGRFLFSLESLKWGNKKKTWFVLKSLWNPNVTSTAAISLALNFHDYTHSLSKEFKDKQKRDTLVDTPDT